MACKYPALISAVVPFGALALVEAVRRRSWRIVLAFALGWAVVMTPWLVKNVVDTGNPVYPLAYRVFGGRHWDAARERQVVGRPRRRRPITAGRAAGRVGGRRRRPVRLAVAPVRRRWPRWPSCGRGSRRAALALWGYVGLSLPDLVAADPPARPLLAADAARPGRPGGPGGRLGRGRGPGRSCSASCCWPSRSPPTSSTPRPA